jgi:hypothetical protein
MPVRVPSKNRLNQNPKYQKPKAMKHSSILMSSFGALLILISINENALKKTEVLSEQSQTLTNVLPMAMISHASSTISAPHSSKIEKDFGYLKFNVADFITTEAGNAGMPDETDFDFLKFKVSDYIETEAEIGVLPEDSNFDFLKFDVNKYALNSYNSEELPASDLDYLKFDVNTYTQSNSLGEIIELADCDNK